jgi:hypothetical protein
MAEGASFEGHLAKLRHLFAEMRELGEPVPESAQKHTLLGSLLSSWKMIVLGMRLRQGH